MPLPIHDEIASTANLAKSWLMTLDRKAESAVVPTATLVLWLETLIALAEPVHVRDTRDRAAKTLLGFTVQNEQALQAEAEAREARAGAAY